MKLRFALLELCSLEAKSEAGVSSCISALKEAFEITDASASHCLNEKSSLPAVLQQYNYAVICGSCTAELLEKRCAELKAADICPIVVIDALASQYPLDESFSRLEASLVQLGKTEGVIATVKSGRGFVYAYEKSDCTSTIVLLFDKGKEALVIERLHPPFPGRNAFPGGFLRVLIEDLEDCAYRELEEETGLKLNRGELVYIDTRSKKDRDPRSHIADSGYAALFNDTRKAELMSQLQAGDDASKAHLLPVSELLQENSLAFDHRELLVNCLRHFNLA